MKKAFTLAEMLIALTVLGIVAAITIPPVVRRQIEASNRTKIKKIMGVYDGFIQKAVIENDIKSEDGFRKWADSANAETHDCENSSGYFKITKYVGESDGVNNKCEFTTADGVVLDITDPLNPVIAPSEKDYLKYKADNNYSKAYKFVVSFDKKTGAFRVNDITYEMAQLQEENTEENKEKIEELKKLYSFLNNEKVKVSDFVKNCTKIDDDNYSCGGTTFKKTPLTAWTYDGSNCHPDAAICDELKQKSKAEDGEYFTANVGGNKNWEEAKTECAKYNAEVANVAQLQRMKKDGTLKCEDGTDYCIFWASEETSDGSSSVMFRAYDGYVGTGLKANNDYYLQVLCVGK